RFYQDIDRDAAGTCVAYQQLIEIINASAGPKTIQSVHTETATTNDGARTARLNTRFLPVSAAAAQLGKGQLFGQVKKLLCKLVHPSAYLMSNTAWDGLSGGACDSFFQTGASYALHVYDSIEAFAESLGVPPMTKVFNPSTPETSLGGG